MKYHHAPQGSRWSAAAAANQVEGAWSKDGKGLSIADCERYNPKKARAGYKATSDITSPEIQKVIKDKKSDGQGKRHGVNLYHTYLEDTKKLAATGINTFRISVVWGGTFPNGDDSEPNERGLEFYDNLFDELHRYNTESVTALSYYEMPLDLVLDYDTWHDPKARDYFMRFAKIVVDRPRKKAKYWVLINETDSILRHPFSSTGLAKDRFPNKNFEEVIYQAMHDQFAAAALTTEYIYGNYTDLVVGSMITSTMVYPYSNDPRNSLKSVQVVRESYNFSDIQIHGDYSLGLLSKLKKLDVKVTEKELKVIRDNTTDFVAFSYYSSIYIAFDITGSKITKANRIEGVYNKYSPTSGQD